MNAHTPIVEGQKSLFDFKTWSEFEEVAGECKTRPLVEAITFFLSNEKLSANQALHFIFAHPDFISICNEMRDDELAMHVLKERLLRDYRKAYGQREFAVSFNSLAQQIKACVLFNVENFRALVLLLSSPCVPSLNQADHQ